MLASFQRSKASGIIFLEDSRLSLLELARQNHIPHVLVHPVMRKHDFMVDIDDFTGILEAVKALSDKGARGIVLVGRNLKSGHNRDKAEAFLACLKHAGLRSATDSLYEVPDKHDLGDRIRHLSRHLASLHHGKRYDAVFAVDPAVLEITESALAEAKIIVPRQMLLAVFGFHGYAKRSRLPLGVVEIPHEDAALTGVEVLLKACHDSRIAGDIRLLKTHFRWL